MAIKFASALLCFLCLPAHADQVIGIADGDTLTLLVERKPVKIRLADIDAPEKKQAFGQVSKQSLSDLCFGKDATYQIRNTDRYGRTVARVTCAGVDVNRAQVERGMAWVHVKFSGKYSLLIPLEQAAKSAKIGLWSDEAAIPPWEYRRAMKEKNSVSGH